MRIIRTLYSKSENPRVGMVELPVGCIRRPSSKLPPRPRTLACSVSLLPSWSVVEEGAKPVRRHQRTLRKGNSGKAPFGGWIGGREGEGGGEGGLKAAYFQGTLLGLDLSSEKVKAKQSSLEESGSSATGIIYPRINYTCCEGSHRNQTIFILFTLHRLRGRRRENGRGWRWPRRRWPRRGWRWRGPVPRRPPPARRPALRRPRGGRRP